MKVEKNKYSVLTISYDLFVDNGDGEFVKYESRTEEKPLVYLYGVQSVLPAFEEKVIGMGKGDAFNFEIPYDEAYGDYDEEKMEWIPKSTFKVDGKLNKSLLVKGKVIPMSDEKGNQLLAEVVKVEQLRVKMDFNHPLAGYDLRFVGKILEIREADEEEVAHGHVHGPGGHHH
ncbi:FKBP-type peptidyl-prolyl cis-trans isomerase [Aureibacter tunicatorum]|uniref:Peptidyl-prolyl cis-trans isomerase n=1 Tax=Aureibacter tunicatorum TaxID=866807 RepID=A0AAE3XQ07_9BACT|nr:FKBP-type peptidyl-prolyl cis-trans isomerase [Aureibacter tunicatorum]MDR6239239.1 FKBP-type peptidyl-prolyl cis-trans isomerase SlyD [Aureibacter tunicatorum]BDD04836.1 peptidyl-prolyl cis-trans isomerase [Aureibacter tunicatorum]